VDDEAVADETVMQPRCIFCKREQYAPAVYAISLGEHPCCWCGRTPPVFTDRAAYREALKDQDWRAAP
jgi:hypothetical protein